MKAGDKVRIIGVPKGSSFESKKDLLVGMEAKISLICNQKPFGVVWGNFELSKEDALKLYPNSTSGSLMIGTDKKGLKLKILKKPKFSLKQELIEPFITLEKKGIRPVIGFTQTQYQGTGEIEKRFYAGFHRIVNGGQEPYISLDGKFLSATDALKAIIEATK